MKGRAAVSHVCVDCVSRGGCLKGRGGCVSQYVRWLCESFFPLHPLYIALFKDGGQNHARAHAHTHEEEKRQGVHVQICMVEE